MGKVESLEQAAREYLMTTTAKSASRRGVLIAAKPEFEETLWYDADEATAMLTEFAAERERQVWAELLKKLRVAAKTWPDEISAGLKTEPDFKSLTYCTVQTTLQRVFALAPAEMLEDGEEIEAGEQVK